MTARAEDFVRPDDPAPVRRAPRVVLAVAALVVLGSVASLAFERLALADPFPLCAVRFDGELGQVQERDLQAAVSDHLGGGLLGVDVRAVRRAVEALPWVAAASVRRVWPGALRITVTEEVAVARWGENGLLNAEGGMFRPERLPATLPRLSGPPGTEQEVLHMYRWLERRLGAVGQRPTELALDARRSWTATLSDGATLVLGRQAVQTGVARLIDVWPRLERAERPPRVIDLRYPNGFAVRWAPERGTESSEESSERTEQP